MVWLAAAIIVLAGAVLLWARSINRYTQNFGEYSQSFHAYAKSLQGYGAEMRQNTEALLTSQRFETAVHEDNRRILLDNLKLTEELKRLRSALPPSYTRESA